MLDYKAIIFDWDGTLVDTCGLVLDAHNHVRERMGYEKWTLDHFLGRASKSAREYYPEIYGERADEAREILNKYVIDHHLDSLRPMPDSALLLEEFKILNIPLGVVSNKAHDILNIEVKALQWGHYFTCAIGAGHAAKDKPAADPLLMAIKKIDPHMTPSDILYVGDTETDLLCAQNAGCPVALIQSDKPRPDLVEKYQPEYAWSDIRSFITSMKASV